MNMEIGFIGQGWIGKNYADDFESRGFGVVRYSLEEPYVSNKDRIASCDIVLIAVPTPSTPAGFKFDAVRDALKLVRPGAIAVIKSTVLPGTTEKLQAEFPDIDVFHSPEFLTEATAAFDAAHPQRNIIGLPKFDDDSREKAMRVMAVLPKAPYELVCRAREAELIKYGGNCWFYFKVVYINMLFDLAEKNDCDYKTVRDAMAADPRIGSTHLDPVHKSGRGAGGHCFIKDFKAFSDMYAAAFPSDANGKAVLESLQKKNNELLIGTGKDLDLLRGVYGDEIADSDAGGR